MIPAATITSVPSFQSLLTKATESSQPARGSAAFGQILESMLANHADASQNANNAIDQLALGKVDDLHKVSLAVAEADITFRLLLEMRNRLTEAYQEIMRMQI